MHKMLALSAVFVVLFPISADGQALHAAFFHSNNVWQRNSCWLAIVVRMLEPF